MARRPYSAIINAVAAARTGYSYMRNRGGPPAKRRRLATAPRLRLKRRTGSYQGFSKRKSRRRRVRRRTGRRGLFNMSSPGIKTLRLHNVTESSMSWTLNAATPVTGPLVNNTIEQNWVPPQANIVLQESIWDSYLSHKLLKLTWKLDNFRVFVTTQVTVPAVGAAPATTDTQTVEMKEWKFWYWRKAISSYNTPPSNDAEEQYSSFCHKDCHDGIWGTVKPNTSKLQWDTRQYAAFHNAYTGSTLNNLPAFLFDHDDNSAGIPSSPGLMKSSSVYILPDDPYPNSFYSHNGTTTVVTFTVMFDCHSYTTWSCRKALATD